MSDISYTDSSRTPRERAAALLNLMTLREKVGQLNQRLYGFNVYKRDGDKFSVTDELKQEVRYFGGIGTLYGLYRADPWADKNELTGIPPRLAQKAYNTVQRYVVNHSRLHIPMLLSSECPHGHQALDGGILPTNLAVGSTFDENLLEQATYACGQQLNDNRVDLALMSVLDMARDPRWGRCEECYSEDPYLASRLAASAVTGMQRAGVTAVAKHLCAQGETTGGINASAARIGKKELNEIHLPVVKAVCDAHVGGVMAAYNEIDGVLCHANRELLTGTLRERFGFTGVVMADGCALDGLDIVTGDNVRSGAAGLKAGVDISLWDRAFTRLEEAVEEGLVTEKDIDRAVLRVLELKFARGLFENPYMLEEPKNLSEYDIEDRSLQLARESVVLLKNDGVLPAGRIRRILVTGPNADDRYRMMGDYTPPVAEEHAVTVLQGIRKIAEQSGIKVEYAKGCELFTACEEELEEAGRIAKECDLCIAVLGGSSSRFEKAEFDKNGAALGRSGVTMDCGEGRDISEIRLNPAQERLVDKLKASGTKVVSVIISGRPYGIGDVADASNAVLQSFYPGPLGGLAIAEILFGKNSPQGRLPVSVPTDSSVLPVYYNMPDSCRIQDYSDNNTGILYGFGYGLSYSEMVYSEVELAEDKKQGGMYIRFNVRNTGKYRTCAIPMLFLHHRNTVTVQRRRELKWYKRIELKAGESADVCEKIDADSFLTCNAEGHLEFEPGETDWWLADGGTDYAKGIVKRIKV